MVNHKAEWIPIILIFVLALVGVVLIIFGLLGLVILGLGYITPLTLKTSLFMFIFGCIFVGAAVGMIIVIAYKFDRPQEKIE